MKRFFKYIAILIILAAVAGFIYWQYNKKHIIKQSIQDAIAKKTDSLYYLHYDSSKIDEVNGDASFYNVTLQSDSAQKDMLDSANDLPDALYIIKVDEVKASGVDIAGLIENENVAAQKIILNKPYIQIINTGIDKPKPFTYDDTLALYKKILGRFKSISAGAIEVINGTVLITNRAGKSLTTFENINIKLNEFVVDSSHNYENIISYFIKNVWVSVENIQLPETKNNTRVNIEKLVYDAGNKTIKVATIRQYKVENSDPLIDLKNIEVDRLNTNAFIVSHQLQAGFIKCDGGLITIYKKDKEEKKSNKLIQFSSELIDEAQIQGVQLGKTKIVIIDPLKPNDEPFIINDVAFLMPEVLNVTQGNTVNEMITKAKWKLSVGNLSLNTKKKMYNIAVNNIQLDNKSSNASIANITVKPLLTEAKENQLIPRQHDRYNLNFNNIQLHGINFEKLINDQSIEVDLVSMQPVLKIANDRTLPANTAYKTYPNQKIQQLGMPLYLKKIQIRNGVVVYTELAEKSEMAGTVSFTNVNAEINNITNIESKINANSRCWLTATALFLGVAKISTQWDLPLKLSDTTFTVSGYMGAMHATDLNRLIEPLALASVKKGEINKLTFNIRGNNYNAKGNSILLYNDLNIELLKKGDNDELKKKEVASFLTNALIKNNNPQNGITRKGDIDYNRDVNKSFFNLLWKSIFSGVKKITTGNK